MSSNYLTPSDLKTILHSKRANIYYLEKCRVQVNGGRVEYATSEGKESYYWNIPIANTTALMLGMGTSVTRAAMREFAHAGCDGHGGVMVGFVVRMARRCIQQMKWMLMSPGSAHKVNIALQSISSSGFLSGLLKTNDLLPRNVFS